MKNNILVMGGGGFLGAVLVERLLKEGYRVKILDSFIYGRKAVEKYANTVQMPRNRLSIRTTFRIHCHLERDPFLLLLLLQIRKRKPIRRPDLQLAGSDSKTGNK